jgi:hypothetical protein
MDPLQASRDLWLIREVRDVVCSLDPDFDQIRGTFPRLLEREKEAEKEEVARKRVTAAISVVLGECFWQTNVEQTRNLLYICLGALEYFPILLSTAYSQVRFIAANSGVFAEMLEQFEEVAGRNIIATLLGDYP